MQITFRNLLNQGLRIEYFLNGLTLGFLLGSDSTVTVEADSLHPNTQALVNNGSVQLGGTPPTPDPLPAKPLPMSWLGTYVTGTYRDGSVVKRDGKLWLSIANSNEEVPTLSATKWILFANEDSNTAHIEDFDNPHNTDYEQVGAIPFALIGQPNGLAYLGSDGKLDASLFPALTFDASLASAYALRHTRNGDEILAEGTGSEVSATAIKSHIANVNNPHNVTLDQLGGTPAELIGQPGGLATLDGAGGLTPQQWPKNIRVTGVYVVSNNAARDALISTLTPGAVVSTTSTRKTWMWTGSVFTEWLPPGVGIQSIQGFTTPTVNLTTAHIPEHHSNKYFTEARVIASATIKALQGLSHVANRDIYLNADGPNKVSASQLKAHIVSASNPHNVTAAQVGAIGAKLQVRTVTSDYTLIAADSCMNVRASKSSQINIHLPLNLPVGFQATITMVGTGDVVIDVPSGNLQSRGNTIADRYSSCVVYYLGSGIWEAIGNLT